MKTKLLCILHRSPPAHGAAKVGDFIASNKNLKENFECRFITIKSSATIGDIGKFSFTKFYLAAELYVKILLSLLIFKPQKIYFTASIKSFAFYRDLFIATLLKTYHLFKPVDVYYHYHTKGVNDFVTASERNLQLTRFFVRDVNLVLLSPVLEKDFEKVKTFKEVYYLPNGVENSFDHVEFEEFTDAKYKQVVPLQILYLSNMIKSKGYFSVLKLANNTKDKAVHYHFAGGWQRPDDEKEFFDYINQNELAAKVTFHGFVEGVNKRNLFKKAHFFIFPTRYENEAFPLSILEALSYGLPIIATDEGSIPYILDEKSGIIIDDVQKLRDALNEAEASLFNKESAIYCRNRYLENFSLEQFESNFVEILNG